MKNLEQIRAANALRYARSDLNSRGTEGGDVVRKLPALIMTNGLLAAAAFAFGKGESDGWSVCFAQLTEHLRDKDIGIVPAGSKGVGGLIEFLTSREVDSQVLQLATGEALAWLAYARRFVKKPDDQEDPK